MKLTITIFGRRNEIAVFEKPPAPTPSADPPAVTPEQREELFTQWTKQSKLKSAGSSHGLGFSYQHPTMEPAERRWS